MYALPCHSERVGPIKCEKVVHKSVKNTVTNVMVTNLQSKAQNGANKGSVDAACYLRQSSSRLRTTINGFIFS